MDFKGFSTKLSGLIGNNWAVQAEENHEEP
jgi:hypothetical protein